VLILEIKKGTSLRYWDIHVVVEDDCKPGYSIFMKGNSEQDAVERAVKQNRFEADYDVYNIDYIVEISKEDYMLDKQ
jgi:hypothetical protein